MNADYVIRPVRAEEWATAKEFRLAALRDPVAPIAFLETYEEAQARPEEFWRARTARAAAEAGACQFVAEGPAGDWAGTMTVLVEEAGEKDFLGERVEQRQAHVVGVFVRPEHRGGTLAPALLRAAVEWGLSREGVRQVRLFVHRDNARAEAFYRRAGFARTREVGGEYEMEYLAGS
ncbi:GNAT family N-acetyltransferase [Streptomyces sp. NPDC059740]|uniref:GNAT family N-acetyltransferase n=1 Tax=Streptomyces sp. NPDC059740 TaxID=3346926 RepID=UPI00364EE2DE